MKKKLLTKLPMAIFLFHLCKFFPAFAIAIPAAEYQELENPESSATVTKSADGILIKGTLVTYQFNICEFEGSIKEGSDVFHFSPSLGNTCDFRVKVIKNGFSFETIEKDKCERFECGNSFDPTFVLKNLKCTSEAISKKRNAFKLLYDKKKYADAKVALQEVFEKCKNFLALDESRWMTNDLALTQFRLGDRKGCLKTLEPLENLLNQSSLCPSSCNGYAPENRIKNRQKLFKAIETNFRLCKTESTNK